MAIFEHEILCSLSLKFESYYTTGTLLIQFTKRHECNFMKMSHRISKGTNRQAGRHVLTYIASATITNVKMSGNEPAKPVKSMLLSEAAQHLLCRTQGAQSAGARGYCVGMNVKSKPAQEDYCLRLIQKSSPDEGGG